MNRRGALSHLLVATQLAGIALACYPVGWVNRGPAVALTLSLCGALFGLYVLAHNPIGNFSVYPEVKTRARLITDGPYRRLRHPMYTALIAMMSGVALFNGHWLNALGAALVVAAVAGKARREERLLAERFAGYPAYAAGTWRFIPYLY